MARVRQQATPGRRLAGGLMLFGALIGLILTAAFIAQVFLAPQSDLRSGVIYDRGHQVITARVTRSGYIPPTKIPVVFLRLDDGAKHTVESTPLYDVFGAGGGRALRVDVQLDANSAPKRIRYRGKWYGAGPPVWFWVVFGALLGVATVLLARGGIRRLRPVRG